jgi:hypothetical protein
LSDEGGREVTYGLTDSGLQLMGRLEALGDWTKSCRRGMSSDQGAGWLDPLVSALRG